MQNRFVLLVLAAVPGLFGCKSDSYQSVPLPPQDVEVSRADRARIYVVRDDQIRGKVRNVRVYQGEQAIGSIAAGSYLCWERRPGRSLLRLIYEGPIIDGGEMEGVLDLVVEAGDVHYYVIQLNHVGKPHAIRLGDEDGKLLIATRRPAPFQD